MEWIKKFKIPSSEIVIFREKTDFQQKKLASKELRKRKLEKVLVVIVFLLGFIKFALGFEKLWLGLLIIILPLISLYFSERSLPSKFAIGNKGLYLDSFLFSHISWSKLREHYQGLERGKRGIILRSKHFYQPDIYLITKRTDELERILRGYLPTLR